MTDQPSADCSERQVSLPARYESLEVVREFVGQAAGDCGLDGNSIYAVQLAVDEAFTNIIDHAYGGECEKEIQCTLKLNCNRITIDLRDCGRPFDPSRVPNPDLTADLEHRQEGGLGFYFMRKLMDEIHFKFIPASESQDGCNILTMVKYRGAT